MSLNKLIDIARLKTFAEGTIVPLAGTMGNLANKVEDISGNCAAAHNGIYRGKNLLEDYTIPQIHGMISDGTFSDLYVGDYFDLNVTDSYGTTKTYRCIIAGLDLFWGQLSSYYSTRHHAVCVTKEPVELYYLDLSSGYTNSWIHTSMLNTFYESFNAANPYMFTGCEYLTSGVGHDGVANSASWTDSGMFLMSEAQVFGTSWFSCSEYDAAGGGIQFPLYALNPSARIDSSYGWYLRTMAKEAKNVNVGTRGELQVGSGNRLGIRPYFLMG